MPPKILVVDDEEHTVWAIRLALERAGFEVVTGSDGPEALEKVRDELPDLILLDMMMPRMDGFEVIRDLKAEPATSRIPVIMLSGKFPDMCLPDTWPYPPHGEGIQYFRPSPVLPDYLFIKPFNAADMIPIIGRLLESRTGIQAAELPEQGRG